MMSLARASIFDDLHVPEFEEGCLIGPQPAVGQLLQSVPSIASNNSWSRVTNAYSISGTNLRVFGTRAGTNEFFRLRRAPVDASTLSNKLMFGYQGWFAATNDGGPPNRWVHWFRNGAPYATNATVDFWPDTSELDPVIDQVRPIGNLERNARILLDQQHGQALFFDP